MRIGKNEYVGRVKGPDLRWKKRDYFDWRGLTINQAP